MSGFVERNRMLVEEKLSNDGLYSSLLLDPAYNKRLFDDKILSLDPAVLYSTTMLSEKIFKDIPNSTMRGYVRDLEGYIDVLEEAPRKKRIPYLSVFKIHMVLLTLKRGESFSSIKIRLGLKEVNLSKKQENDEDVGVYREKYNKDTLDILFGRIFNQMQQYQSHFELQGNRIEVQYELTELKTQLVEKVKTKEISLVNNEREIENEIRQLERELSDLRQQEFDMARIRDNKLKDIENVKNQITIHRLYRKLDLQTMAIVNKHDEANKKNSGIFSMFSKKASIDFENEIKVDERLLKKDHIETQFEKDIIEYEKDIKDLDAKMLDLKNKITEKERSITDAQSLDISVQGLDVINDLEKDIKMLENKIKEKELLIVDDKSLSSFVPIELDELLDD